MIQNLTSVIIPTGSFESMENINRTIKSLLSNADEDIEVIVLLDNWATDSITPDDRVSVVHFNESMGERRLVNQGFSLSRGEFVFRVDAHCSVTPSWDIKLKESCRKHSVAVCVITPIDEETWEFSGSDCMFVYVSPRMEEKWWSNFKALDLCDPEERIMSLTGCGWMSKRDYFLEMGGFDEALSKWGCIGPEMSLMVYGNGGDIVLRTDVRCGHLFHANSKGYPVPAVQKTRKALATVDNLATLYDLQKKFQPVPEWKEMTEEEFIRSFQVENIVSKEKKIIERNSIGEIVKETIIYYQLLRNLQPLDIEDWVEDQYIVDRIEEYEMVDGEWMKK